MAATTATPSTTTTTADTFADATAAFVAMGAEVERAARSTSQRLGRDIAADFISEVWVRVLEDERRGVELSAATVRRIVSTTLPRLFAAEHGVSASTEHRVHAARQTLRAELDREPTAEELSAQTLRDGKLVSAELCAQTLTRVGSVEDLAPEDPRLGTRSAEDEHLATLPDEDRAVVYDGSEVAEVIDQLFAGDRARFEARRVELEEPVLLELITATAPRSDGPGRAHSNGEVAALLGLTVTQLERRVTALKRRVAAHHLARQAAA